MSIPPIFHGPDIRTLQALFPSGEDIAGYEVVSADQVPAPYDTLLVHEHHMTVTVERHHGSLVNVDILDRKHQGDTYARKILLRLQSTGRVVQFGIVRIHLQFCDDQVRSEIIAGKTPLGRILIEHDVLRRIEPTAYLRIIPGRHMMGWFGLDRPTPTYGRLAFIHCNEQPAIELLEIVAP
jgi:hypothetical protein